MHTMSKGELEDVLSNRLPQCKISCLVNPDSSMSVEVTGPDAHQFTIANIDRVQYLGEEGIARLAREIMEEMVLSRQTSHLS